MKSILGNNNRKQLHFRSSPSVPLQRGKWMFCFSLLFIFISSCTNHEIKYKKKTDLYWYTQTQKTNSNEKVDTIKLNQIFKHKSDSLIDSLNFRFNKQNHTLRLYSNFNSTSCVQALEYYELDSLGAIYLAYSSGGYYDKLISTNDSINRLINFSIREIKRNKSWFKFVSPIQERVVIFEPPIITD
jgi:hypothetical protein